MHVKDKLVVLIDETQAADESMHTYITDDDESVDWLATASTEYNFFLPCQQVEFQHCQ